MKTHWIDEDEGNRAVASLASAVFNYLHAYAGRGASPAEVAEAADNLQNIVDQGVVEFQQRHREVEAREAMLRQYEQRPSTRAA
jgi:hypothetical protein